MPHDLQHTSIQTFAMDKVMQYRTIVRKLLSELAPDFPNPGQWEVLEIYDEEHGQCLLFTDGWQEFNRDYGCFMHIKVKTDCKLWLRRDGTDINITKLLEAEGIPKSDIVLGFKSPHTRTMTEYAVG